MTADDRLRWDDYFEKVRHHPYPDPDPLLLQYTPPIPDGETRYALDFAGGFGQNGLWLASQGYTVDILDISRIALSRARAEMGIRNLRTVNLMQQDIDEIDLAGQYFDVVAIFRYLRRQHLPMIQRTVKPGGRLIYETYNMRYLEQMPEFNPEVLLHLGELEGGFYHWQILLHEQDDYITRFVAVKPE